jgi:hypothetical protein
MDKYPNGANITVSEIFLDLYSFLYKKGKIRQEAKIQL